MRPHPIPATALLLSLLACGGRAEDAASPLQRADAAAARGEYKKAATLYAAAARDEKTDQAKADAELRLANIEWRILGDPAAARTRLKALAAKGSESFDAFLQLSRIEASERRYDAAQAMAEKAAGAATTRRERSRAAAALADAVLDDPRRPDGSAAGVVRSMRQLLAEEGRTLRVARLLVAAGALTRDAAAIREGVDAYYHVSAASGPPEEIVGAHRALTSATAEEELVVALAGVRFFEEAAMLARAAGVDAPRVAEIVAYADALGRIEKLTNSYYRDTALGEEDEDDLRDGITAELRTLWPKLQWPAKPPRFTHDAAVAELGRRFGTYVLIGKTSGHVDAHIAHRVVDSRLEVRQYGRSASTRFIALDGVVSNGYSEWALDGRAGDGGWGTATEIYQVRPRYADGPLHQFRGVADPETRAEIDRKIAEATPIAAAAMRLERQYFDRVLLAKPDRDAFIAHVEKAEFDYSILHHEGRHAIDAATGERIKVPELEYRAKLSSLALSEATRLSLASVLEDPSGDTSPHGVANQKLAKGLEEWMQKHRTGIAGLDAAKPLLPQVDKLTDEQIRAAARSLDPLAK